LAQFYEAKLAKFRHMPSQNHSTESTTAVVPLKPLLGLTAAVLLLHLVVLQGTAMNLHADSRLATQVFATRAIAAPAAPAEPAIVAAPTPAATPDAAPVPSRQTIAPLPQNTPANTAPVPQANLASATAGIPGLEEKPAESGTQLSQEAINNAASVALEIAASAAEKAELAKAAQAALVPALPMPATSAPTPAPPALVAATVPAAIRLTYKTTALVKGLPWSLDGELVWQHDGANYNAKLQWSATFVGTKTLTSSGQIGAGGLLPQRFSDKFRSSEVAAHFERDKQKITFSANTPDVPLLPGMQDQLSVFVQLGAMLAAAPTAYPKGTRISFETIGARSADTWVFVVESEETLNLATGEVKSVKLMRPARGEFDQTAELWLAPQLGYLPARIKVSERNGDYVDQVWRGN
jgi:hypothetical protein